MAITITAGFVASDLYDGWEGGWDDRYDLDASAEEFGRQWAAAIRAAYPDADVDLDRGAWGVRVQGDDPERDTEEVAERVARLAEEVTQRISDTDPSGCYAWMVG